MDDRLAVRGVALLDRHSERVALAGGGRNRQA
jgi:hypothetical protein